MVTLFALTYIFIRLASPHHYLPLKTPSLLVVGSDDIDVPPDMVQTFFEAAVASNSLAREKGGVSITAPTMLILPATDHYFIFDSTHVAWLQLFGVIDNLLK